MIHNTHIHTQQLFCYATNEDAVHASRPDLPTYGMLQLDEWIAQAATSASFRTYAALDQHTAATT